MFPTVGGEKVKIFYWRDALCLSRIVHVHKFKRKTEKISMRNENNKKWINCNLDTILQEIHASIAAEYYCNTVVVVVVIIRHCRRRTKTHRVAAKSTLLLTADPQLLRTAPAATPMYPRLIAHDGQRP